MLIAARAAPYIEGVIVITRTAHSEALIVRGTGYNVGRRPRRTPCPGRKPPKKGGQAPCTPIQNAPYKTDLLWKTLRNAKTA